MNQSYEVPAPGEPFDPSVYRLGLPCKRNHLWADNVTIRAIKSKGCPLCARIDALDNQRKRKAKDPKGESAKAAAYQKQRRAEHGRPSRSKHGLPYTKFDADVVLMRKAIKGAGQLPSVAQLVYEQQREYWLTHPADRIEYVRQRNVRNFHWRYMTDLSFRLYHRSKSKKRKAQERGSRTVMLSSKQLWHRWVEFDNRCAYCGCKGDLQVEHVIPISQGGEHHLGNIVPACQQCNYSKSKSEVISWYKEQHFFNETRWLAIQSSLANGMPPDQLILFV